MIVAGVVLCGGRSNRMGRPKAWLPFGGELLLPRVVRLLAEAVAPVVVVAAPGQDAPPLPAGVAVVRDETEGRGPLQGITAGLKSLRGRADAAFVFSCDAPFLQPAFVRRLIELLGDATACVPCVGGRCQPLAAVYRLDAVDTADVLLKEDRLSAMSLVAAVPTRIVEAAELVGADPTLQTLRNLNTPEEYETALRELVEGKET